MIFRRIIIDFDHKKVYNNLYLYYANQTKEEKDMVSAIDVSRYVIAYYNNNRHNITNLKLQKILYYVQGYSCKAFDEPAFDEHIYNWPYGPVVPDVYFEYNDYGNNAIFLSPDVTDNIRINSKLLSLIRSVIEKSLYIPAYELVEKTHSETPWLNTSRGEVITVDSLHSFFKSHDPLGVYSS